MSVRQKTQKSGEEELEEVGGTSRRKSELPLGGSVKVTRIPLIDRVMLIGPPGIGKTEILKQRAMEEAERLHKKFVDLSTADDKTIEDIFAHPSDYYVFLRVVAPHIFPEDLQIPRQKNGEHRFYEHLPPKAFAIFSLPGIHGVLFLDELTNVIREDQISMYFSLIQEKEVGWGIRLSPNVKVIAAGNPDQWSEIARVLPKPLRAGKLILIHTDAPSVQEWADYMEKKYGDNWEKLVYAYLFFYKEDFIGAPKEGAEWEGIPTPRSWTQLALLLKEIDDVELVEAAAIGIIGREAATRFLAVYLNRTNLEKYMEMIKNDPSSFSKFTTNEKILVLSIVSQNLQEYKDFVKWLLKNDHESLSVLIFLLPREKKLEILRKDEELRSIMLEAADTVWSYLGEYLGLTKTTQEGS